MRLLFDAQLGQGLRVRSQATEPPFFESFEAALTPAMMGRVEDDPGTDVAVVDLDAQVVTRRITLVNSAWSCALGTRHTPDTRACKDAHAKMAPDHLARSASLPARALAELVGTALLLATVVGSGIMAERLAAGAPALALLCNSLATGAGLVAILLALGPVSGAHLNPAVTAVAVFRGQLSRADAPAYVAAQLSGAIAGVALAHAMFEEPVFSLSTHVRAGPGQLLAELVATAGLLLVTRTRSEAAPFAVGAYITAAYWFTASTSFANPAVTIARCLTRTYAGIRAADAPGFLAAQAAGAVVGGALLSMFADRSGPEAEEAAASPEVSP